MKPALDTDLGFLGDADQPAESENPATRRGDSAPYHPFCSGSHHQMGQGASTPHNAGNNSGSAGSAGSSGNRDAGASSSSGNADGIASRRLHRRIHSHVDHIARLGSRLMPSSSSSSVSSSTARSSNRLLRFRNHRSNRPSESRSPSPAVGDTRDSRRRTMPPISYPLPSEPEEPEDQSRDFMDFSPVLPVTPSAQTEPSTAESRRSRISRFRSSFSSSSWTNVTDPRRLSRRASQSHRSSVFDPSSEQYSLDLDHSAASLPPPADSTRALPSFGPAASSLLDGFDNPTRVRPGEDQAAMLSRLLSVAAAATAASLVGNAEQAITEAQDVAGDNGGDGSFESFLRTLQNGRLAAALRNGGNEMGGGAPTEGSSENGMLSLNFFRMFRFGSTPSAQEGPSDDGQNPSGRTVPVIIVGIRSVTPRESDGDGNRPQPFFDALANLPVNIPSIRRGPRLGHPGRRASMGSSPDHMSSPLSEIPSPAPLFTETPPGPLPPPSTPTPSSANPLTQVSSEDHFPSTAETATRRSRRLSSPDAPSSYSLPRSTSTAETTGRRRVPPANMEGTRSWIIYVLGGSYPENHPILTTPSLFTDAPTYDDMLLLSSLLGPAKPPVAAQTDVDAAGGTFIIDESSEFKPSEGERCLVCLCDYEEGNECRKLTKCKHVFHKECIDQWLTTGRNSCPLCRGEGVEEKEKPHEAPPADSPTDLNVSAS